MKKLMLLVLCLLTMTLLGGCGSSEQQEAGSVYQVYMVNKDETRVSSYALPTDIKKQNALLQLLLAKLQDQPRDTHYRAAIPDSVSLPVMSVSEETVYLEFSEDYYNLSTSGEILSRAAIVRTLTQVPGITYCAFEVAGNALTSATGEPIGIMRADQFIDNNGNEINTEEKVTLVLYFANEAGDGLVRVDRDIVYSSNIPIEKLIVEQLLLGTTEDEIEKGAYPVINADTRLLSVTEKDGICYVNFDSGFLAQTLDVTPEVALYAIVNSLVELGSVNRVQISVNGETGLLFREKYSLDEQYDRNLDLINTVTPKKTKEVETGDGTEQEETEQKE